ncbi:hypothetical protein C731_4461 [Mycolicibacterium hassiacum DSM 44199]|jgi:hypothetical protein|uniref:Uncharacterized protein n=1 Tax=Mycolicibacterium hassiacum (strain DSM 44199 / CIP 105218 / JCM 12690 / 3849) TaxID=1122247 RepID=K5B7A2_MYCHD|nr:OB-fold domain-containing protein [Mycolicibacterium hassiacum]EKF21593.1 hypothetical protein C731_4461 [Mycolicibacterium hassiacum DSM 44199]MBX5487441.1 OB-fold domain-containing protein [Mycolicibacterium hassiacum]MDA4085027.1 DNA-binding protein [Mycolicibacterium hassiacum DSM 44199]PZN20782.1 MAG: DNA-binding protein [Mycolicibacterium hassiacum]VCT89058.1 hypothetical protein MHAS_00744 [Mycolicibacterium hassiacum DSM 44199]
MTPDIDTDSESWWAAIKDGTLMVNHCRSCDRNSLYPRPFCPHCWSEDVALEPASGRGRLYTWSVIRPAGGDPYVVAMIDLDEGPRVMSAVVDCDPADLAADLELQVAFRDDDGVRVPVFRPI